MDIEEMRSFLRDHFRYPTMNSWNDSTSYAHNVKLHALNLSPALRNVAYDLIDTVEFQEAMRELLDDFSAYHGYEYQAGFNGRSGGYLVLYQGGQKADGTVFTWSGRPMDQREDFSSWDEDDLRKRVEIVQSFDKLRDDLRTLLVEYCNAYDVVDVTVLVPRTERKLKRKEIQLQLKGVTDG